MDDSAPDALPAIVNWVATQTILITLTGGRVYGESLPEDPVADPGAPGVARVVGQLARSIVIVSAGGVAEEVPVYHPRYELRVYAPTRAMARALFFAANAVIDKRSRRDFARKVYVSLALNGGPNGPGPEPDSGYIVCAGFYDATVSRIYTPGG